MERDSQQTAGRQLLFGPRQLGPTDAAGQHQADRLREQRAQQARCRRHIHQLDRAQSQLIAGDAQPLLDLLAQEPAPDLVAAERQGLEELIERLACSDLSQPRPQIDRIEALQALRRRAALRQIGAAASHRLQLILISQLGLLVGDQLTDKLASHNQQIGPLPRVWTNGDLVVTHFRDDSYGMLVCDELEASKASPYVALGSGEATPLSYEVSCRDCLDRYHRGTVVMSYRPDEWLALWRRHHDRHMADLNYQIAPLFGSEGPGPELSAEVLARLLLNFRTTQIDRALRFSAGRLLPADFQA